MDTVGAMPPNSFTFWTDSLLHRSAVALAMLPRGERWAQAASAPSMAMG